MRIVGNHGQTIEETTSPIAATNFGGSSQAIPFDLYVGPIYPPPQHAVFEEHAGYLCLVHERKADPDPMHGQRNYQRRFVWFDDDMNMKSVSRRFTFGTDGEGEAGAASSSVMP